MVLLFKIQAVFYSLRQSLCSVFGSESGTLDLSVWPKSTWQWEDTFLRCLWLKCMNGIISFGSIVEEIVCLESICKLKGFCTDLFWTEVVWGVIKEVISCPRSKSIYMQPFARHCWIYDCQRHLSKITWIVKSCFYIDYIDYLLLLLCV